MKIKDLGGGNYTTFPITDDMIEVEDISQWVRENTSKTVLNAERIMELKTLLAQTDYIVIKHYEGEISDEEYIPIKEKRKLWREEINSLE